MTVSSLSSLAVANEFLARGREAGTPLTHMHVQKLVYLGHGFSLGSGHGPLVEDRFEAWSFGPVIRKLYDALKRYGPNPVPRYIRWGDDTPFAAGAEFRDAFQQMSEFQRELADFIYRSYSGLHAFQLSRLTHQDGSPWQLAFIDGENRPIRNKAIQDYFTAIVDGAAAA